MLSSTLDLEANPFVATLKRVDAAVAGFHGRIVTFGAAFSGISDATDLVTRGFDRLRSTIDLGGELNDLSAETGETASNLLIFRQALANTRAGAEGITPIMARWQKALAGLNEDGKPTTKTLNELGLSSEQLVGRNVLDQVGLLGARFRAIEDPARRAYLAQELFGKGGGKFLGVLNDTGAIDQARTQVGGLAGIMDRLAPILDTVGDAIGSIELKLNQLVGGALLGAGEEAVSFAEAFNRLDLTGIGIMIGNVVRVVIMVGNAVKWVVPIVLSLGVGWLASATMTTAASVSIVSAVTRVTVATVAGIRAIMISLGPVGIAIAALTFLWLKFRKTADQPLKPVIDVDATVTRTKPMGDLTGLGVGSLTARGLNAFNGVAGSTVDPVAARIDRTNSLLEQVRDAVRQGRSITTAGQRPNLPV